MRGPVSCAIIGAGPAGLSAALYLTRFRRSVVLADKGLGRAALIPRSHNYPGFPDGVNGQAFLDSLRIQISRFGKPQLVGEVKALEAHQGGLWRVLIEDRSFLARTVLIATGVVDRRPDLQGVDEAIAQGLLRFCPICDGFEAQGERIAVIGDDNHAAREALFIRRYSDTITVLSNRAAMKMAAAQRERLVAKGIELVCIQPGSLRLHSGAIEAVSDKGAVMRFTVAYAALGVIAQSQLVEDIGVVTDERGGVLVDERQQTLVPGIYAAGDIVRGLDQISVAVGEAAIAATAIHNSLAAWD